MAAWPNPKYAHPAAPRGCARCRAALLAISGGRPAPRHGRELSVAGLDEAVGVACVARAAHGPVSGLAGDDGSPLEPGDWCRAVRLVSELGRSRPASGGEARAFRQAQMLARRALGEVRQA
jgi:hypothetical protein